MRKYVALLAMAWALGCGPPPTNIAVSFSDLSSEVVSVEISVTMNGKPALGPMQTRADVSRVYLDIVPQTAGDLELDARGLAEDGCVIARGSASARIDPAIPIEIQLPLPLLLERACGIDVHNTNPAGGRVVSDPPAIDCGTRCSATFPPGTEVTFRFEPRSPSYHFSHWSGACDGAKDCRVTIGNDRGVLIADILPVADWFAAAGSGSDDIWAVGARGSTIHWNGLYWSSVPTNTAYTLRALWVNNTNDIDAVGDGGTILHYDGTSWSPSLIGSTSWRGVWEKGSISWVVGERGAMAVRSGGAAQWGAVGSGTSNDLNAIWGSGPSDLWAAGSAGTLLHYDGTAWAAVSSGTSSHLYAIFGTGAQDVWIVGAAGMALHYDGTAWRRSITNTAQDLHAIWAAGPNATWAAGTGGTVLALDSRGWMPLLSLTAQIFFAICNSGAQQLWFFGAAGTVAQYVAGVIG